MRAKRTAVWGFIAVAVAAAVLAACGSGDTTKTTGQKATVRVTLSDPATCAAPKGPYRHVFVSVREVLIHRSASANNNDAGWISLTPDLPNNPKQIDLLATGDTQCLLGVLGSMALDAGSYEQIRLILVANNNAGTVAGNQCGPNAANCLVLDADGSTHTLKLNSQDLTGIKIPPGRINGGAIELAAGEAIDLNIDFNACASIVREGTPLVPSTLGFRMRPVLHAGEVSTTDRVLTGKVVDSVTQAAIQGGNTVVALLQPDAAGVGRVLMETVPDAAGNFRFCPLPAGTYTVVATAVNSNNVAYAATVLTGVPNGANIGNLPLVAVTGTSTAPASITGSITSAGASGAQPIDVVLSALQSVNGTLLTIPLASQSAATANLSTATGATCAAGTACVSYTASVPPANPNVGAFSSGTISYSQAAPPVGYTIDAQAFAQADGTATCNPVVLQTSQTSASQPLNVTAGASVEAATLAFTSCQ